MDITNVREELEQHLEEIEFYNRSLSPAEKIKILKEDHSINDTIDQAILITLSPGKRVDINDIYKSVYQILRLTIEDINYIAWRERYYWKQNIQSGFARLKKRGAIEQIKRNKDYQITDFGLSLLA